MLISKEVEINLYGKKVKHYEELGYELPKHKTRDGMTVKRGTKIKVKIEDMPTQSHELVLVSCDYCGKEYYTRYDGYIKRKQNDINLDCCNECKSIKNKELNLLRYGVENQYQREEIKNKIAQININKYGFEYPMQNKSIKFKAMKTMSDNNGVICSRQQKYLHQLFGGCLNYVDESTKGYAIDIALVNKKIAIEYCGSGHDLQVKFGNKTLEQYENDEIKRYQILKRNGWKQIIIYSPQDYLPSDVLLLEELNKALNWFKTDDIGHFHYNININDKVQDLKYGHLRKIKEEDLEEVI